jgi:hypothetical protein
MKILVAATEGSMSIDGQHFTTILEQGIHAPF